MRISDHYLISRVCQINAISHNAQLSDSSRPEADPIIKLARDKWYIRVYIMQTHEHTCILYLIIFV